VLAREQKQTSLTRIARTRPIRQSEVQIALLSERIGQLTIISKRPERPRLAPRTSHDGEPGRSLLDYLKKYDSERYKP